MTSHFAQATRHRHIDTDEDVMQLKRKMLLSQLPEVREAYPFVADDWDAVEFRAPNVMQTYKMDIDQLRAMLSDVSYDISEAPELEALTEQVGAPPEKALIVLFGRKNPNLMIDDEFYTNVKAKGSLRLDPTQVGKLIQSMRWSDIESVDCHGRFVPVPEEKEKDDDKKEKKLQLPIKDDSKQWPEDEIRAHPSIVQYKLDANLPGRFPSQKVAQQMFMQHIGCDPKPYMGRQQTTIPSTVKLAPNLVDAIINSCYSPETLEAIVETPQAQDLYYAMLDRPVYAQDLIKALFNVPEAIHKRYLKRYPEGKLTPAVKDLLSK